MRMCDRNGYEAGAADCSAAPVSLARDDSGRDDGTRGGACGFARDNDWICSVTHEEETA